MLAQDFFVQEVLPNLSAAVQFPAGLPLRISEGDKTVHVLRESADSHACSAFRPSVSISAMVLGRPLPDPGNTIYKIPPRAPPFRASDRMPRFSASATEPSPMR